MSAFSCFPTLPNTPAWRALGRHRSTLETTRTADLFAADPERFDRFAASLDTEEGPFLLDPSKNRMTEETFIGLFDLAEECGLPQAIAAMFAGEIINHTEGRAAFHAALRAPGDHAMRTNGTNVTPEVHTVLDHVANFVTQVRDGTWQGATHKAVTDIVNIGIGGSDLGPAMVCQALAPYARDGLAVHFVSNVDATHITQTLRGLNPETTLFIITSKTFTTQETLRNATTARDWLIRHLGEAAVAQHFVAVSTNAEAVSAFGINPHNMFAFWDWVGGRYSLWSAVGISIALFAGMEAFRDLLAGAFAMDEHFQSAPMLDNLPVLLALVGIWNHTILGIPAAAVLPYDQSLARFPAYLQQLEMESNGKSVTKEGQPVAVTTAPILFGEPGTNGQHSFYQLLHQGTRDIACDIIIVAHSQYEVADHQPILLSNALAQSEALMRGCTREDAETALLTRGVPAAEAARLAPHKTFPGNRPSTTLLLPRLTPKTLGMLIALYEHKVFVQSIIWGINAFDQWGVELGKTLASAILPELQGGETSATHDGSTAALIDLVRALRAPESVGDANDGDADADDTAIGEGSGENGGGEG
ncbi:MAG: glucose-6-phosphate isomerase [Rhodospirillaceae bacterium]|nr:glucose-6-phosphate isomerase [Rhodospirillaceae bacterium]